MLADYHIHLERGPYSLEWLQRFLDAGLARGVAEFGITEHGHRFREGLAVLDNDWVRSHSLLDLASYVDFILAAKAAGLPVKLGLEMDYIPGKEEETRALLQSAPFDYVIGSVHWLGGWGFDFVGDETCLREWGSRDTHEVYARYFETVVQAAESGLFDTLGHPDLVKIMGIYPPGEWFSLAEEAIVAIARTGVCIEVSSAGLRKPVGEIYPSEPFLRVCRAHGIPVTMASDAHEPEDTGRDFDRSTRLLRACGYEELQVFAGRVRSSVTLG